MSINDMSLKKYTDLLKRVMNEVLDEREKRVCGTYHTLDCEGIKQGTSDDSTKGKVTFRD